MGGIICQIQRNAILQYAAVPTDPKELKEFDDQLRACFAAGEIALAVSQLGPVAAHQVCTYLWDYPLTAQGREFLYKTLESLW